MLSASTQIRVREARLADADGLADVFRESWRQTYRGIIPHVHLEAMIRRRGSPDWWVGAMKSSERILVLDIAGTVGGYATSGIARGHRRGRPEGEIYELYLSPANQGVGLGELLFEGCRHALDVRQLQGLMVWALSDNRMATDFYWRRGGRPVARSYERFGKVRLEKIAFSWN